MYIGTISSWLDKKLILESLNRFDDIEYCFYGPVASELLNHPRIRYMGKIDHDLVLSAMKQADALIMPFIVNELILAVNPVKLYEYVSSGKPVISVHYPEVNQFEDYVHLYKNKQEYFLFLEKLITNKLPPKMPLEDCQEFARNNTWAKRVKQISEYIEEL